MLRSPLMFDPRTVTEPGAVVLQGNALDLPIPDETVDLIITSPPYFALRSYRDGDEHYEGQIGSEPTPQEFLEALWAATREMIRVLKPSGSIWVNLGDKYAAGHGGSSTESNITIRKRSSFPARPKERPDLPNPPSSWSTREATGRNVVPGFRPKSLMGMPWRYAIGCIDQLGLILRAEVIWSKPNGLPESVTDRVRRSHEQWFHFTKQGRYFAAVDEVREAYSDKTVWTYTTPYGEGAYRIGYGSSTLRSPKPDSLGKLPGSVWTIPSEPLIIPDAVKAHYDLPDHFAAFPQEWPRRIILGWAPRGICVACDEGRRPVVEKDLVFTQEKHSRPKRLIDPVADRRHDDYKARHLGVPGTNEAAITGYVCACSSSDGIAPTRPAIILDPFGGTGTVAMVARALGRFGISIDLSADYCRLAEWRIFQSGHAGKTESRTNLEAQGGLF